MLGCARFLTAKLDLFVESFDLLTNQIRTALGRYVDYCDAGIVPSEERFQGIYALPTPSPKFNIRLEAGVIMYDVAILVKKHPSCEIGIPMPIRKFIGRFIERQYRVR